MSTTVDTNGVSFVELNNGKKYMDEEAALSVMLKDGILFCNTGKFDKEDTVVLFVICNDIFAWGCADAECFTTKDIEPLYIMHRDTPNNWGTAKWCCLKRKEQPQAPVKEAMIKDGAWDESLDKLEENYYDKRSKELHNEQ